MDADELFDLMDEIDMNAPPDQRAALHEQAAAGLEVGEHGRAALLVAASEHWRLRDAYGEAHRCLDEAEADGGHRAGDLLASRLALALEEGDEAVVGPAVVDLRTLARRDDVSLDAVHEAGEALEEHGRLPEALRMFTLPFTYADPDDEDLDQGCLAGRYRVRRALGLGPDRFDVLAARVMPALAERLPWASATG